eukprot:6192125-Pleurochrysis_carterae.AAC.1
MEKADEGMGEKRERKERKWGSIREVHPPIEHQGQVKEKRPPRRAYGESTPDGAVWRSPAHKLRQRCDALVVSLHFGEGHLLRELVAILLCDLVYCQLQHEIAEFCVGHGVGHGVRVEHDVVDRAHVARLVQILARRAKRQWNPERDLLRRLASPGDIEKAPKNQSVLRSKGTTGGETDRNEWETRRKL